MRTLEPHWNLIWGPRKPPPRRSVRRNLKGILARLIAIGKSANDPRDGLAVLAYHGTAAQPEDPWWIDFPGHMRLIEDLGYRVVSLANIVRLLRSPTELAEPTLAITFDDGYSNNMEVAFPELARRGWPATVFLTTSFLGRTPFLAFDDVRRLSDFGVEAGNHTHRHTDLRSLSECAIAREISDCNDRLANLTGYSPRHFCYPFGTYSRAVRNAVASSGLESAVTGRVGRNKPGQDVMALRRLTLERGDSAKQLRLRLAGGYDFLDFRQRRFGRS